MEVLRLVGLGLTPDRLGIEKRKGMDSKICQDEVRKKFKNGHSLHGTYIQLRDGKECDAALESELGDLLDLVPGYLAKIEAKIGRLKNFIVKATQRTALIHADQKVREDVSTLLRDKTAAFDSRIDTPSVLQHIMEILPGEKRGQFALSHRSAAEALSENVKRVQCPEGPYSGLGAFVIVYKDLYPDLTRELYVDDANFRKVLTEEERDRLVALEKVVTRYQYRTGDTVPSFMYIDYRNDEVAFQLAAYCRNYIQSDR